ncbi:IS4 family transposase [Desulfosarcina ovata subsp. sediminis]|uniref:IS4 family transposase n=2 Tax=Desulfosarcina ovata subsp. sediminis TaxID=885957 RepID=A0A5K7ZY57_9BACT|nr:IS1634 family transposase [Desulfosarcina ovata]BBO83479.1 IS4 family transposase [Desulfosarcina ovata subsp. sediminis]BBO85205.1 IS4 family transposase [Desulfosarcina ovata subsp. sediminis]
MEQFETRFKQVDVLPMVKYFMDQLDLFNLFSKYVPASEGSLAEHAQSLCILIANIICDNKPLYKVQEWLCQYTDGLVTEPVEPSFFNDDRLARALSALFHADRHTLMTEASCNAISVHQLLTEEIHNDSTSVTFIGKYETPDPEAVKLKHGHNKDFRPDCKQVVFGLNITADGHVPLSYQLFDGNTTDDVTHIPNWNGLRTLLGKEDFIYIADCKLKTEKNLTHIADEGGLFITIVPKNHKEYIQFIKYLKKNEVPWEDAFSVENSRKKGVFNVYRTYEAERTKEGFRVIFVHSSTKQKEDEARRQKKIDKAIEQLESLSPKLNAYHLKTKKEIKAAIDKIVKDVKEFIDVRIATDRRQIKVKVSPGRPSLKSVYKNKWEFTHRIEWKLIEQGLIEASRIDGIFPLITNTQLEASEVLGKYKNQPFLEKRMYTKKSILEVAPVFIKKEHRIEAMLFLYFIALMIVSLIERKIRMNMTAEEIDKLPILPQGMNTKKPTWNNIRYFYRNVHFSQIIRNGVCIQSVVKGIGDMHKLINRLLEIPEAIYSYLQDGWWQFKAT